MHVVKLMRGIFCLAALAASLPSTALAHKGHQHFQPAHAAAVAPSLPAALACHGSGGNHVTVAPIPSAASADTSSPNTDMACCAGTCACQGTSSCSGHPFALIASYELVTFELRAVAQPWSADRRPYVQPTYGFDRPPKT